MQAATIITVQIGEKVISKPVSLRQNSDRLSRFFFKRQSGVFKESYLIMPIQSCNTGATASTTKNKSPSALTKNKCSSNKRSIDLNFEKASNSSQRDKNIQLPSIENKNSLRVRVRNSTLGRTISNLDTDQ